MTQVMLSKGFGGGERLFVDMSLELAERGHMVQAICHPQFEAIGRIIRPNITITPLECHNDYSPFARFTMRKAFRRFQPDVVHAHMCRASMIAGSAGKALGIPVVANIHNYINIKYYKHIQHLFPGTHDQERYLIAKGIDHGKITVIPHFSRIPAVDRIPSVRFDARSPLFISLGRFVPKKGFHILIEAIKNLHENGIEAQLVLGGDGPEKERLLELAAGLGLSEHVRFYGWVDDIADFLSQSDLFVLPSLDEPFGIVILEAMALGKVIVSTLTKGPQEVLDDSCAYCCDPGDVLAMSARLKDALDNREKAEQKAISAWRRYKEKYSPEVIIPRFEEVYNTVA